MNNAMILYNSVNIKQLTNLTFIKSVIKSLISDWRAQSSIAITKPRFKNKKIDKVETEGMTVF